MNHTSQALEVSRLTGWDIDAWAEERDWAGVGLGPVGRHRDSDCLERSNWEVVTQDLGNLVEIVRHGHWAVGWVEELTHDTGNPEAVTRVADWRKRLGDYPVANEDHFSRLEFDEA